MCIEMVWSVVVGAFFFQAEDGIRDLVRSRGLGDVYKRQGQGEAHIAMSEGAHGRQDVTRLQSRGGAGGAGCLSLIHI